MLRSKYSMAVATALIAFGAGAFMQNGGLKTGHGQPDTFRVASADFAGMSGLRTAANYVPENPMALNGALPGIPLPPLDTLQPLPGLGLPGRMMVAPFELPAFTTWAAGFGHNPFGAPCTPSLNAVPVAGGFAELTLSAPCELSSRLTLSYSGLSLAYATSVTGELSVRLPVFERRTTFEVSFAGQNTSAVHVVHPQAAEYLRAGISWSGRQNWAVHALEFGADYFEPGHVFIPDRGGAATAGGGTLIQLGDPALPDPMMAEVYSISGADAGAEGAVRLSIEAQITAFNCGTETGARTMRTDHGESPAWVVLSVGMPNCDTIGGFLVLKNPLRDIMIAQN